MSEKLIIFILLVVYLARPKKPDEIQISGEMDSGCLQDLTNTRSYKHKIVQTQDRTNTRS